MAHYQQAQVQQSYLVHTPAKAEFRLNSDEARAENVWNYIRNFFGIEYNANFFNGNTVFQDTCVLLYCITHSSNIVIVSDDFNKDYEANLILVARIVDRVSARASVETLNLNLDESDVPDIVRSKLQISSSQVVAVSQNACKAIARLYAKYQPNRYQSTNPPSSGHVVYPENPNRGSGNDGWCLLVVGVILLFIPVFFWIGVILICVSFTYMNN